MNTYTLKLQQLNQAIERARHAFADVRGYQEAGGDDEHAFNLFFDTDEVNTALREMDKAAERLENIGISIEDELAGVNS